MTDKLSTHITCKLLYWERNESYIINKEREMADNCKIIIIIIN
jgi:hypothetical protein